MRPLLHEGGRLPHPFGAYEIKWTAPPGLGACLFSLFRAEAVRIPLATCGVAVTPEASPILWDFMADEYRREMGEAPPALRPAAVPWCGVILHKTALLDVPAMEWLGDFERCVAWAWIERERDDSA